jgi:phosphoribosylanthranilate isomerase
MRLKICGIRRAADVDCLNEARTLFSGPDYAGFVFAPSRRQVSPAEAAALRARLDPGILPVGVFVDADIDLIRQLYQDGVIQIAQLHGHEDGGYVRALRHACGIPVIQALRARTEAEIPETDADFLLLDSGTGSGIPFDWALLRRGIGKPWFLAGGISLANMDAALALRPRPWGIDISSGAETDGWKDRKKILALAEKVDQMRKARDNP